MGGGVVVGGARLVLGQQGNHHLAVHVRVRVAAIPAFTALRAIAVLASLTASLVGGRPVCVPMRSLGVPGPVRSLGRLPRYLHSQRGVVLAWL